MNDPRMLKAVALLEEIGKEKGQNFFFAFENDDLGKMECIQGCPNSFMMDVILGIQEQLQRDLEETVNNHVSKHKNKPN